MGLEKPIQDAIMWEFSTRADMRLWRANAGAAEYEDPKTGQTRMVRFGTPGQADLSGLLNDGTRLEIEVKAPGRMQSIQQRNFQNMINDFGGIYILAYSVDDVYRILIQEGYIKDRSAHGSNGDQS